MNNPVFSFVIPVFNCNRWLGRALTSVMQQQGAEYEILIVDDGSSEPPDALIAALPESGIKLLHQQNAGAGAARNLGIAAAQGTYVWCLDCDDELVPDSMVQVMAFLNQHPDTDLLVGGHINQAPDGRERLRHIGPLGQNRETNFSAFLRGQLGSFSHGAVIVHRRVFERLRYPESIRSNEDMVLHAQMLALYAASSIHVPLVRIHTRPDSQRHNIQGAREAAARATELLFDADILPGQLMGCKAEFHRARQLELFRDLYKAGLDTEARQLYTSLVRSNPQLLLRFSYLKKFIRLLF